VSAMVSLIVTVAVLQYSWTKELSHASEARIGSNLRPLMMGWHLDLYSEFSAICVALQVGADSGAHENWKDYLRRYVDWAKATTDPDSTEGIYADPKVVKNIYIWETHQEGIARLQRLNPETARIESSTVPEALQSLLSRLQSKSSSLPVALRAWKLSDSPAEGRSTESNRFSPSTELRIDKVTGWQFDQNVPAIVHPIVHLSSTDGQPAIGETAVDWVVVVLDLEAIQKRVIPNLTRRYFSGREGLEYKLAVTVPARVPRVIYTSDPGFPVSSPGGIDSKMNIFGSETENVEGHFWETIKDSESLPDEEWHSFSAPVWFPVIQYSQQDEPWMLILQHRAGPLEATATSIWRRNLMTGSIVLLLLTVDMGLVVIAGRRAQKLAALQLDFVASISHELLTPLAAIYSIGENARDGISGTKADLREYGSVVTAQSRQLIDLVKQILLFASTQNGTQRYNLRPLQVPAIVQSVRKNMVTLVEDAGFEVEQHLEPELPFVIGDWSAVTQCLQNLIANAVKYSGTSQRIDISATRHRLGNQREEVQISVHDHGIGIHSSEFRHIFEPFYRSPKVLDAQIHGTGLGLAVAKRIAEAMGGRLSVTSTVGVGSTFTLHLQIALHSEDELATQRALSEIESGTKT
jgi:signal transduction histidine kinase